MINNYNWSLYPEVKQLLNKLYKNTINNSSIIGYDKKYIKELISYTEDYIFYLVDNGYDINNVIERLNKIDSFGLFNMPLVKVNDGFAYEPVKIIDNSVMLNKLVMSDERLSIDERRRLHLYIGLSHILINLGNDNTKEFNHMYDEILYSNVKDISNTVSNGWSLLEDNLSQELAERITYSVLNKKRPGNRPGRELFDPFPIDGALISSNLEQNRYSSAIIPVFGITIGGIVSYMDYSEQTIINNLLKVAINKSLSKRIINEYMANNNEFELYQIMYLFGKLANEKVNQFNSKSNTKRLTNEDTRRIMKKLADLFSGLVNLNGKVAPEEETYEINKSVFVRKRLNDFIYE